MKEKVVMRIIMILILVVSFTFANNIIYASTISGIVSGADEFVDAGKDGAGNVFDTQVLDDTSSLLYNTLLILGICIAVIVGAVLGIQFITGSVEQKVKVKESLIPFIVGCVIIFSAFGIWRLVIIMLR